MHNAALIPFAHSVILTEFIMNDSRRKGRAHRFADLYLYVRTCYQFDLNVCEPARRLSSCLAARWFWVQI